MPSNLRLKMALRKSSISPERFGGSLFRPLEDPKFFRQVKLNPEIRTIQWPNGADFDPETLYHWDEDADWFRRKGLELEQRQKHTYSHDT